MLDTPCRSANLRVAVPCVCCVINAGWRFIFGPPPLRSTMFLMGPIKQVGGQAGGSGSGGAGGSGRGRAACRGLVGGRAWRAAKGRQVAGLAVVHSQERARDGMLGGGPERGAGVPEGGLRFVLGVLRDGWAGPQGWFGGPVVSTLVPLFFWVGGGGAGEGYGTRHLGSSAAGRATVWTGGSPLGCDFEFASDQALIGLACGPLRPCFCTAHANAPRLVRRGPQLGPQVGRGWERRRDGRGRAGGAWRLAWGAHM